MQRLPRHRQNAGSGALMDGLPGGPPILGRSNRILITQRHILYPNGVMFRDNGLEFDGNIAHLQVVNGVTGEAWLCPLPLKALQDLAMQAQELIFKYDNGKAVTDGKD
jgi:hypothetical protein